MKTDKKYEIALINLETYYGLPNVDDTNNHFSYSPDGGGIWYHILIPEGSYDIEDYIEKLYTDYLKLYKPKL